MNELIPSVALRLDEVLWEPRVLRPMGVLGIWCEI
jgi:hypothetical protein